MPCPPPERLLLLASLHLSLLPLPLSLSPSRPRWTACPACSASFSAATTSSGKSSRRLTPSSPQDSDGGVFSFQVHSLGSWQGLASKLREEGTQPFAGTHAHAYMGRFAAVCSFWNPQWSNLDVFIVTNQLGYPQSGF